MRKGWVDSTAPGAEMPQCDTNSLEGSAAEGAARPLGIGKPCIIVILISRCAAPDDWGVMMVLLNGPCDSPRLHDRMHSKQH